MFDVSQTEGEPLPNLDTKATGDAGDLVGRLTAAADDLKVEVESDGGIRSTLPLSEIRSGAGRFAGRLTVAGRDSASPATSATSLYEPSTSLHTRTG